MKRSALALSLLALCSCNSDSLMRVASTLEVGYAHGDFAPTDALGVPSDGSLDAVMVSIRPLAALEPPTKVIVVHHDSKD